MKNRRQQLILQAVEKGAVSTQEQIIEYLRAHGEAAAQATVSRDIKVLGLRKSAGPGGRTVYEMPPARWKVPGGGRCWAAPSSR